MNPHSQTIINNFQSLQCLSSSKETQHQIARNIGILWADCFSEKPTFRYIFKDDSKEERYQRMIWTMEHRARLALDNLTGQVLGEGVRGTAFGYFPQQKSGFHPLKLLKEGFAWVPIKFGYQVFKRMNEVSMHEIEVYKKTPPSEYVGIGRIGC